MKVGEIWKNKTYIENLVKILYIECNEGDNHQYYLGYQHINAPSDVDQIEHMVTREWFLDHYYKSRNEEAVNVL